MTLYPDVNEAVNLLLHKVRGVLGSNFVGMYLHGSLASGDFNLETSDVDFVIVTTDVIQDETLKTLAAMHKHLLSHNQKWLDKLEGSYITQTAFRQYNPNDKTPWPTLNEKDFYLAPHEPHWIIQRHIIREQGIVIAGPTPKSLIDPVYPNDLRNAVKSYLYKWWQPMLTDSTKLQSSDYQAYAILSMCRTLYTLQYGEIASKPVAAKWIQQKTQWRDAIEQALNWHNGKELNLLDEARELITYTIEQSRNVKAH